MTSRSSTATPTALPSPSATRRAQTLRSSAPVSYTHLTLPTIVAILGALMEKAPVVSNEILGEAIRIELGEKKAKFLEGNMKALEAGEAAARG